MPRETVRIALMIAAITDLKVKFDDILNAYIQVHVTEKVWTTLCPKFNKDAGKTAVIVSQQEQLLEAMLLDARSHRRISLVTLILIDGINRNQTKG